MPPGGTSLTWPGLRMHQRRPCFTASAAFRKAAAHFRLLVSSCHGTISGLNGSYLQMRCSRCAMADGCVLSLPAFSRLGSLGPPAALLLAASLLSIAGCNGRGDLAAVRGKVMLDGEPLGNAFVVFAPTDHGTTSYGRTDGNGRYEMMFTDTEKGAWIGNNSVRISTGDLGNGGGAGPKERVPVVYNEATTLTAD